jgi:hypothetical protein
LTWQWELRAPPEAPYLRVGMYDVDGQETPARTVRALHRRGTRATCYLSAGSWERWRPDAKRFPKRLLGRPLAGWPGERWVDVGHLKGPLARILRGRLDVCARKGFDAVEPDNLDAFEQRTGFGVTAREQLAFNRWLAREAHRRGMAVWLKNDPDQAASLAPAFDGALVEQCVQYRECRRFRPFAARGKPVLDVEYRGRLATVCRATRPLGIRALRKHLDLGPWRRACP